MDLDHRDADVGHGHAHAHTREEVRSGKATTDGSDAGYLVGCAPQHGGHGALGYPHIKRGVHRSVQAAERRIRSWLADWNGHPRPFV
ncbi:MULTISPECIES: hypothetical protein [unclassified Streptomyces]|uniref:hypothetical protein n=1 Tax=unclassified Streptomyces TaxID=2593676 RepID=UPI0022555E47|nr:hypothetical protein [Streptomyces sp. NBC_00401]MCX5083880.1 hypothetical protein [Streptomyces sp. NBC_00401]